MYTRVVTRRRGEICVSASRIGRQQDELVNATRMLQGERLSDKSAHRPSQHAHALETERLDYVSGVISEPGDVEWPPVVGRTADPAVVQKDHLVGGCEPMDEQRIPIGARCSESV